MGKRLLSGLLGALASVVVACTPGTPSANLPRPAPVVETVQSPEVGFTVSPALLPSTPAPPNPIAATAVSSPTLTQPRASATPTPPEITLPYLQEQFPSYDGWYQCGDCSRDGVVRALNLAGINLVLGDRGTIRGPDGRSYDTYKRNGDPPLIVANERVLVPSIGGGPPVLTVAEDGQINVRSGPGTDYNPVGTVNSGGFSVYGASEKWDDPAAWFFVDLDGDEKPDGWIAGHGILPRVDVYGVGLDDIPVVTPPPTATPMPATATPTPRPATATPIALSNLISLLAFHDFNGNGSLDSGEPPISGITNSTNGLTCTTGGDGSCALGNLPNGRYTLAVQDPSRRFRYILPSVREVRNLKDGLPYEVNGNSKVSVPLGEGFLTIPIGPNSAYKFATVFDLNPAGGSAIAYKDGLWVMDGHYGIDFVVPEGTSVRAAMPGEVTYVGQDDYGGLGIWICYGPWANYYNHNSKILVKAGQEVYRGQEIALSGNTGQSGEPHVHFALTTCSTPPRSFDGNNAYDPFLTINKSAPARSPGYWTAANDPKYPQ